MRISRFTVNRPIFTVMVTLIVMIIGGVSLSRLPIDLMPDITYPTLSVSTNYASASPEEVEELVTRPVEQAMSAVPGVEEVSSASTEGRGDVRISFAWGTDLDAAANDIRDRLDRVIPRLPEDAERPRLRKFDLASFPVLIMGASSDLDPVQLRRIIEDQVKYRLERVPGVAAMDVWGGLDREIHVDLNADKIKALGLSLDTILARISTGNVNVPAGSIDRGNLEVMIRTPGEFANLDEIRQIVVSTRDGAPILLREVGEVEDSWERVRRVVRVNGRPGVRLSISKQSGTNTVEVATKALAEVERINRDLPQLNLVPIIDTSTYIQRSISNVSRAAVYGGILAIVVLLFFLRDIRSTAVIATAIPVSVVATFALIYFAGFTLNIMTLGGLALGVGMLLDNAIVVLENITRLRDSGRSPVDSALDGSEEVASAIVASTLTTVVVFMPLIFVRGMAGVMFKQLALVVSFALLCSLAAAVGIVPMLAARLLRAHGADGADAHGEGADAGEVASDQGSGLLAGLRSGYEGLLHFALDHRLGVVLVTALVLGGSLAIVKLDLIGVELMPTADEGEVRVSAEMEVGSRLDLVDAKTREIEAAVREAVPELENLVASVGGSHWRPGAHTAQVRISLKSEAERSRSSEQIAAELRKRLAGMPGVKIRTRAGQGLFIMRMGTSGGDKVQVDIRGYDLDKADALAGVVRRIVEEVDGVTDARVSRETGSPEELIMVDRQKAADMKLTVSQIAETLKTALSGTRAGYFREGGNEYAILVQLKNAVRMSIAEVLDLTITNSDGELVVLRNVVSVRPRSGPVRVERKDQERVVTVSANITDRDMGSVMADIRERLRSVAVPRDFSIVFSGDYEEQQKAFSELLLSLVLALVLVYMVMACQYESLRDPFIVMLSVPLAAIGVILALFITRTTFNIQSFIGCIMLGGIVVNNAILLVDHTNLLRRRDGMELRRAIEEAARRRLRPILMTTLTTCLGLLPLAMGMGEGGEAQAPMARVVIGGLLSASLINLVFVPVIYSSFERR